MPLELATKMLAAVAAAMKSVARISFTANGWKHRRNLKAVVPSKWSYGLRSSRKSDWLGIGSALAQYVMYESEF
jgi:hypothetical protein